MDHQSLFDFEPPKRPVGRPPIEFKKEYVKLAYNYSLLGATNVQMAGYFDVSEDTFIRWLHEYTEFRESITRGKAEADGHIAKSLYKIAKGFKFQERTMGMKGNDAFHSTTEKYIAPDFRAVRFWLMNRHPELWRGEANNDIGKKGAANGEAAHVVDWEAAEGCDPVDEDFDGMEKTGEK